VFCRFHVRVSEELALVGVQLVAVIVSVSGMVPVFLMYIVWVAVLPGLRVPTFRAVAVWVQSLSEYTPKFTAVIVTFKGTVWLVLRTATVVAVRRIPTIVNAITATLGSF
jgi:hypothetical protein